MERAHRVTVVIATRNRRDELRRILEQLEALVESPPVIVVDNGSSDGTAAHIRARHPRVVLVSLPANYGAAARSVGARLAATPYVAFCDDDSWWEPGALTVAADWLDSDPAVGLVAGQVLVGPAAQVDPTSALMASGPLDERLEVSASGPRGVTGFLACAAVVRRRAFLAAGGFEPHLVIGGEEELVALDLADSGWKLVYVPTATVRHYPSRSRDPRRRDALLARNHLLTALLRYSAAALGSRATGTLSAARSPAAGRGLLSVWQSVPWALARRRVVSRSVETAFLGDHRVGRRVRRRSGERENGAGSPRAGAGRRRSRG